MPESLITPTFTLHRQRPEDNDADYLAVMASRERLRCWSDSSWPEDDFTSAANLADLEMHIAEHEQGVAYGFSIYIPGQSVLLGSVYISEVAPFIEHYTVNPEQRRALESAQARVDFWLREGLAPDFELEVLFTLRRWLTDGGWWFRQVYFGSRRHDVRQRRLYEAGGLREVIALVALNGARTFYFHT